MTLRKESETGQKVPGEVTDEKKADSEGAKKATQDPDHAVALANLSHKQGFDVDDDMLW